MLRWRVLTDNRVGMVHDVLMIFSRENINIQAMEVIPEQIHLKIENLPEDKVYFVKKKILAIAGVFAVDNVEVMPYEERQQQLETVLNSISEGIIAINKEELITTLNPAAEKILHRSAEKLIGNNLNQVLKTNLPLIDSLYKGLSYDNKEMIIDTPQGESHYLTSGRPILDEQQKPIGAVAVLKDINQVRQLIYKMTQPQMVSFNEIIFQSEKMKQVIELAKKAAVSNTTILIRGESGTGKELFARAIHMASIRNNRPFVPVNCGALPDSLLESELFGYEEGTFTGARRGGKQGLFEFAHRGTLFLDEIGELPTHLQVKLLRVLQEGKFRRLGGSREQSVDVRIIAATNRDLEKMIKQGEFREDLYYRLNVIPIMIPALRQRKEDIAVLVDYFLNFYTRQINRLGLIIPEKLVQQLTTYDWPGNIRQLRNVVERAVNLAHNQTITWQDLFPDQQAELNQTLSPVEVKINQIISLPEAAAAAEKALLKQVLNQDKSSRQIAKMLGVSHTTIINKLNKYHLT